jgi:hypothetical protein
VHWKIDQMPISPMKLEKTVIWLGVIRVGSSRRVIANEMWRLSRRATGPSTS